MTQTTRTDRREYNAIRETAYKARVSEFHKRFYDRPSSTKLRDEYLDARSAWLADYPAP